MDVDAKKAVWWAVADARQLGQRPHTHSPSSRARLESGVLPPGSDVDQPQGCSEDGPALSSPQSRSRVQPQGPIPGLVVVPGVWEPWGQGRADLESVGALLLPRPRPGETGAAEWTPAPQLCPPRVERPGPAGGCPAQPCPAGGAGCVDMWPEACPWPGALCAEKACCGHGRPGLLGPLPACHWVTEVIRGRPRSPDGSGVAVLMPLPALG